MRSEIMNTNILVTIPLPSFYVIFFLCLLSHPVSRKTEAISPTNFIIL